VMVMVSGELDTAAEGLCHFGTRKYGWPNKHILLNETMPNFYT
jgi:hypothetical protein